MSSRPIRTAFVSHWARISRSLIASKINELGRRERGGRRGRGGREGGEGGDREERERTIGGRGSYPCPKRVPLQRSFSPSLLRQTYSQDEKMVVERG